MSESEPDPTRGVRNPKVVDLITFQVEGSSRSADLAGSVSGPRSQIPARDTAEASSARSSAQTSVEAETKGTVVLQMFEDRPFGSDPDQVVQLEEKFNNYIDYVLDGWLVKQYPQYDGKPVRIELLTSVEPDDRLRGMMTEMTRFAERIGLEFRVLTQQ